MLLPIRPVVNPLTFNFVGTVAVDANVGIATADRPIQMWAFDARGNLFSRDRWFRISDSGAIQFTAIGVEAYDRGEMVGPLEYELVARDFGNNIWSSPIPIVINIGAPVVADPFLDTYTGPQSLLLSHVADFGTFEINNWQTEGTLELDGNGNVVQTVVGDDEIFTNSIGPSLAYFAEVEFTLADQLRDNFLLLTLYQDAPGFDIFQTHGEIVRWTFADGVQGEATPVQSVMASHGNGDQAPSFSVSQQQEFNVPITFVADTNYVVRVEADIGFGRWRILVNGVQWGSYLPIVFSPQTPPLSIRAGLWIGEYPLGDPARQSIRVSRFEVDVMTTAADTTPPSIPADQTITFTEGQTTATLLGTLAAVDDGAIRAWRFVASGTNVSADGFFTINALGDVFLTADGEAGAGNQAGTFTYSIEVEDGGGNVSAPQDITVQVDAAAPIVFTLIEDTFTGAAGPLADHTPETGPTWSFADMGNGTQWVLTGTGGARFSTPLGNGAIVGETFTSSPNFTAEAEFFIPTGSDFGFDLWLRDETNFQQYKVSVFGSGGNSFVSQHAGFSVTGNPSMTFISPAADNSMIYNANNIVKMDITASGWNVVINGNVVATLPAGPSLQSAIFKVALLNNASGALTFLDRVLVTISL